MVLLRHSLARWLAYSLALLGQPRKYTDKITTLSQVNIYLSQENGVFLSQDENLFGSSIFVFLSQIKIYLTQIKICLAQAYFSLAQKKNLFDSRRQTYT